MGQFGRRKSGSPETESEITLFLFDLQRYINDRTYRVEAEKNPSVKNLLHEINILEAASILGNKELGLSGEQIRKTKEALFEPLYEQAPYRQATPSAEALIKMENEMVAAELELPEIENAINRAKTDDTRFVKEVSDLREIDFDTFARSIEYRAILRKLNPHFKEMAGCQKDRLITTIIKEGSEIGLVPEQVEALIKLSGEVAQKTIREEAEMRDLISDKPARKPSTRETAVEKEFAKLKKRFLGGEISLKDFRKAVDALLEKHTRLKKSARKEFIQ